MAKQSKKPPDLNRLAAAIVGEATDDGKQLKAADKRGKSKEKQRPAKASRAKP